MKYESQPDWKMRFSLSSKEFADLRTNLGGRVVVLADTDGGKTQYVLIDGCPIKLEIR